MCMQHQKFTVTVFDRGPPETLEEPKSKRQNTTLS